MRKFRNEFLQVSYEELLELGFDPTLAYEMVMELDSDLSSFNTMDYAEVLNITDRMLEEDVSSNN